MEIFFHCENDIPYLMVLIFKAAPVSFQEMLLV